MSPHTHAAHIHAALLHPDRRASSTSVLPRASCSRRSVISPGSASTMSGAADRRSAARPLRLRRQRPTARPHPRPAARGNERARTQWRLRRRRRRPSAPCSRWRQSADCPVAARRAHHSHRPVGCSSKPQLRDIRPLVLPSRFLDQLLELRNLLSVPLLWHPKATLPRSVRPASAASVGSDQFLQQSAL